MCPAHSDAPGAKERRAALATLGGLKAGAKRRKGVDWERFGGLESPDDAQRWCRELAKCLLSGELTADVVRTALTVVREYNKSFANSEVAKRLDALDRKPAIRRG